MIIPEHIHHVFQLLLYIWQLIPQANKLLFVTRKQQEIFQLFQNELLILNIFHKEDKNVIESAAENFLFFFSNNSDRS